MPNTNPQLCRGCERLGLTREHESTLPCSNTVQIFPARMKPQFLSVFMIHIKARIEASKGGLSILSVLALLRLTVAVPTP